MKKDMHYLVVHLLWLSAIVIMFLIWDHNLIRNLTGNDATIFTPRLILLIFPIILGLYVLKYKLNTEHSDLNDDEK